MKLHKLFFPLLAIAAMSVSCSSEDIPQTNNNGERPELNYDYLSVRIANPQSRAAMYENGTVVESRIDKIRFLFFDASGSPAAVKYNAQGGYDYHIDWTNPAMTPDNNNNSVEQSTTTALLMIETPKGDRLPAQILAFVNPRVGTPANLTFQDIYQEVRSHLANHSAEKGFVMTNATYASNNKEHTLVDVTEYFSPTAEGAMKKPVVITVERSLAKVKTYNQITTVDNEIYHKTGETVDKTTTGEPIYVKMLNWNVTTTADKSFVLKHIKTTWSSDLFTTTGAEPWNDVTNKRSYWAYNPAGVKYNYGSYNSIATNGSDKFDGSAAIYCEENAAPTNAGGSPELGKRTQVIVAAELVDAAGNPISIVEYRGLRSKMTETQFIASILNHSIFKNEITINGSAVDASQITLVTEHELHHNGSAFEHLHGTEKHYPVYVQLADGLTNIMYNGVSKTLAEINEILENEYGKIKFWKGGRAYYYTDIRHLGDPGRSGEYGVVRNHSYAINLVGLQGLGTPVYNPDETIIPEKPESDETYLAAKVDVLSWRLVTNNVSFE